MLKTVKKKERKKKRSKEKKANQFEFMTGDIVAVTTKRQISRFSLPKDGLFLKNDSRKRRIENKNIIHHEIEKDGFYPVDVSV